MKLHTLKALGVATAALAFCALASTQAAAQAWPAKPIRWVVPYTPAGITDNGTRIVLTFGARSHHKSFAQLNGKRLPPN